MSDDENSADPFLIGYNKSELRIASEFLSNWLPFLCRDLCVDCKHTLSDRINSLSSSSSSSAAAAAFCCNSKESSTVIMPDKDNEKEGEDEENCDSQSLGSWKDESESCCANTSAAGLESGVVRSSVSASGISNLALPPTPTTPISTPTPKLRMSWADMAQAEEDEDVDEDELQTQTPQPNQHSNKTELSRDQREFLRFTNVRRKKDFICLERLHGKPINVLQGLELHTGVFSAVEQKRIVDYIFNLVHKGKQGDLKERTYTAPRKWMKGKGRVTIQFGCCYNYATDKKSNPPGILKHEEVDPLPSLFKVIIKRLIRWHVLPPSCVPDSCIVNIYEEGDCIPPHIDNHDFVRPFCTVSFLSECNILFGTDLKIEGPGEFSGSIAIPLPVGSVLVLNGNGADVAKHCVPAVPSRRISITFRRMDESKRPVYYSPDPDLQGLEPLCYDGAGPKQSPQASPPPPARHVGRQGMRGSFRSERRRDEEPRYSARNRIAISGPRTRVNLGGS